MRAGGALVADQAGFGFGVPPSLVQALTGLLVPFAIIIGMLALPAASNFVRKGLSSTAVRTIGLYSYTLYLWQQLALTNPPLLPPPLGLAFAFGIAGLSYYTLERATRAAAKRVSKQAVR